MALIFWDAEGILLIDYHPKGKTITEECFAKVLDRLNQTDHEKASCLSKKRSVSTTMR